ncbi:Dual O-methyltransferase/FAD-dependent monooxygenase CTB3 [Pseudocercospora fuligena]|uniref:Dual O-methyltransferase/FAD-dependent monooxygenase CTB3 n=1 Tax=Pseudocercospora fuligena TaxID=685502 RepID=A0A8H6RXQ6_9PEZI|nr:Dual O-methyltransferase/FAD-dependent monooxygenase CTB3 [Pseudocercospora fuligena]
METVPTTNRLILIIGAGVAGLALAQGLHKHGIPFRIYERYPQSSTAHGHRFRCSHLAVEQLKSVLSPKLQQLLEDTIPIADDSMPQYTDCRELSLKTYPHLDSPPISIAADRSWLQTILATGIEGCIQYDRDFKEYHVNDAGSVTALFCDGSAATGKILIGADGARSKVRKQLQPERRLLDLNRWGLWGRTPLTPIVDQRFSEKLLPWCLAHDRAANLFAMQGPQVWSEEAKKIWEPRQPPIQDYIFWAFSTEPPSVEPQTTSEKAEHVARITKTWHPDLKVLFSHGAYDLTGANRLFSSKPDIELEHADHQGKVLLLGDAAHVMSPMAGSGGSTAIINAVDLADTIGNQGIAAPVLQAWTRRMSARAKERIEYSLKQGKFFMNAKDWWEYREVEI